MATVEAHIAGIFLFIYSGTLFLYYGPYSLTPIHSLRGPIRLLLALFVCPIHLRRAPGLRTISPEKMATVEAHIAGILLFIY